MAFRQDFSAPGRVSLRQAAGDPVVGAITLAVAELVTAGTWPRLRICANDDEGFAGVEVLRGLISRPVRVPGRGSHARR